MATTILKPIRDKKATILTVIVTLAFVAAFGYTFLAGMNYQRSLTSDKTSAVDTAIKQYQAAK